MAFSKSAYIMHAAIKYFFVYREGLQASPNLFVALQHAHFHAFFGEQYGTEHAP